MTRSEAWAEYGKAVVLVEIIAISDRDPDYGYTECSADNCGRSIPIVEGMAPEFCPACDPELEDD